MHKIKFSHRYLKLKTVHSMAQLIDVLDVRLEDLSETLLAYDTEYGHGGQRYELPAKGSYLLLILRSAGASTLYTTLRRSTPRKRDYYRSLIGEFIKIEIADCDGAQIEAAPPADMEIMEIMETI